MKIFKSLTYYIGVIIIGVITALIINTLFINKANKSVNVITTAKQNTNAENNMFDNGIGILVYNKDMKLENQNNLILNNGELNYIFKIINNYDYNLDIKISIYLDYKQISFISDNKIYNIYHGKISSKNSMSIPVQYKQEKNDKKLHVLSLLVTSNYGRPTYLETTNFIDNSTNIIARYNICYKDSNYTLVSEKDCTIDKIFEMKNFYGIQLNKLDTDVNLYYNPVLEVKPGEKVTIPLLIGGYKDVDDYLSIITINNMQYSIDNSQYYLHFKIPKGNVALKYIEIQAPNNIGIYEIQADMFANPWSRLEARSLNTTADRSNIITLKVVQ